MSIKNYVNYDNFNEIYQNQEIKIIATGDWNNYFGVVERIIINKNNSEYNMAVIFCMNKPDMRYLIFKWNIGDIVRIE